MAHDSDRHDEWVPEPYGADITTPGLKTEIHDGPGDRGSHSGWNRSFTPNRGV